MVYEFHEYANIFPMLSKDELEELADDIKANGVKEPGMLYQGKILDGRNRYRACEKAGVEMWWEEVEDEKTFDPLTHVLSKNLHRRHLDQSQRAMAAAKARDLFDARAKERQGKRTDLMDNCPECSTSRDEAGKAFRVSGKQVDRATKVIEAGCKRLVELVDANKVKVSLAERFVREVPDKKEQCDVLKGAKDPAKAIKEYITPDDEKATKKRKHHEADHPDDDTADPIIDPAAESESAQATADADRGGVSLFDAWLAFNVRWWNDHDVPDAVRLSWLENAALRGMEDRR